MGTGGLMCFYMWFPVACMTKGIGPYGLLCFYKLFPVALYDPTNVSLWPCMVPKVGGNQVHRNYKNPLKPQLGEETIASVLSK